MKKTIPGHDEDKAKRSSAALQEKRGHRESRLLENVNKMVLESNKQMLLTDFEAMTQHLSDVKKRRKSSLLRFTIIFYHFAVGPGAYPSYIRQEAG